MTSVSIVLSLLIVAVVATAATMIADRRAKSALSIRLVRFAKTSYLMADDFATFEAPFLEPLTRYLNKQLTRAGYERFRELVIAYVCGVLAIIIVLFLIVQFWAAVAFGFMALALPALALHYLKERRLRAFAEGLPELLERIRQLALVGNTLQQAFLRTLAASNPISRQYFGGLIRRIQHGTPLHETVDEFAAKLNLPGIYMMAAAIKANARYGGRIGDTLGNLISQLSHQARLERQLRALTAETRSSAAILVMLSVGLAFYVWMKTPEYIDFFFSDPAGQLMLLGIVGLPAAGIFVMQRILRIDY
jgi:tight adherence protein B